MMVGVMDKIGTFGMIRFCLGLFPEASQWATPVVLVLAMISIIYGAILAIGSRDIMRLHRVHLDQPLRLHRAGHLRLHQPEPWSARRCTCSTTACPRPALFVAAGYLIKRRGSRDINAYGGVQKVAPVLAGLLLFAGLSTLSLPGLSSFVSEFMVLAGTFSRHPAYAVVSTLAIVLAALYILIMYQRTMTGPVTPRSSGRSPTTWTVGSGSPWLRWCCSILCSGVFPKPMLDVIEPAVSRPMQHVGVTDPQPRVTAEGGR